MSGLAELGLRPGYITGRENLLTDFYIPCLEKATTYDRAVGYFRSTLYVIAGLAFSRFARQGGKCRLICSPAMTEEDIAAIHRGLSLRESLEVSLKADLRTILEDPRNRPIAELLATLVAMGSLDVRLAIRKNERGIFHDKVGLFRDGEGGVVSFLGSPNETLSAWDIHGNHEALEVFCSWVSQSDAERVARHSAYFASLWDGGEMGVEVVEFPEAARRELLEMADPNGIDPAAERVRKIVSEAGFTSTEVRPSLQAHQEDVVSSWERNGSQGIIAHATGSGKTIAALEIVGRWLSSRGPALIVVPTAVLLGQWAREARRYLPQASLLLAGAGASRDHWQRALADHTRDLNMLGPRIVLSTMQTGSSKEFLERLLGGPHLLLVADEVHRIGSRRQRSILNIQAGGRLGLSATPERYGDAEGTAAIFGYFGKRLEPEFTLRDAIKAGRLVEYEYHVRPVSLCEDEQEQWDLMTERIRQAYARLPKDGSEKSDSEALKLLLIRRAAILKQARRKPDLALSVLSENYKEGDWWIVYCDSTSQLTKVVDILREAGIKADEYHSSMEGSRTAAFDHFHERGGVLVAIRCLDEGVDIPPVNRALILASSANRREFIQRRGRVLRKSPGKFAATIFDALVVPYKTPDGNAAKRIPILRVEVSRAMEFARDARNLAVKYELDDLKKAAGLTDEDIALGDVESDDGGIDGN